MIGFRGRCGTLRRVFLSVAEDSADMHAAAFVRAARRRWPGCRFAGLTGARLRGEGVETVYDLASHAAMLAGAVGLIRRAREGLGAARRSWAADPPDCVVLLDSPELNLRVAAAARQCGLRVLYYIAPQTWASRPWRNRRLPALIDHLACILPFEEAYFRKAGVRATYVGHPLFESLAAGGAADPALVEQLRGGDPLVAILPGSRSGVVRKVLPQQLAILEALRGRGVRVRAAVSAASAQRRAEIEGILRQAGVRVDRIVEDNASLLTAADLVLVASGTATLHVAAYRKPMIVTYDAGGLLNALHDLGGRWFLRTPHLALVNVLAGARIVPEFMPRVESVAAVAEVAAQILAQPRWRALMTSQLDALVRPLEATRPSERVCDLIESLVDEPAGGAPRGDQQTVRPTDR